VEQLAVVARTATVAGLYAGGPSVMETGGGGGGGGGRAEGKAAAAGGGAAGPAAVVGFPKNPVDDV